MRILHWVDRYPPDVGGTETVVQRLSTAMAAQGHEVAVFTGEHKDRPSEAMEGGVLVKRFAFQRSLGENDVRSVLGIIRQVAEAKKQFAPDVIHLHFQGPSVFFHNRTASAVPAPIVLTVHGEDEFEARGPETVLGKLFTSVDWVTTVSEAMKDFSLETIPAIADRCSVVYNGDDTAVSSLPPADPPYLFASGRHLPIKGHDLAIAAMPAICEAHPGVRLVIAGDGPLRRELEEQAKGLGVDGSVEFTGWVDDRRYSEMLARAYAVLVPSRWREGFGLVALDAAKRSRPAICSARGGLTEVVVDGQTGLIMNELTPSALAKAAIRLLDNPEEAQRLGRQAAERAIRKFGLQQQVDAFLELYGKLASR